MEFQECMFYISTEGFSREVLSCFLLAIEEQNLFLCAPTKLLMASISLRMLRLLAYVSWIILSCLVRLFTRFSSYLSFIKQLRLQIGQYFPIASRCFLSYSQCSKCISQAMKFYCRENCYTLRSIAFWRSTIFSLNLLIFSLRTLIVSQCFLCCLKTRVSFCSSMTILSRMELLLTRSLPCSSAFLFKSLFSFLVVLMRDRNVSAYLFNSSKRLGFEARNLILQSSRLCQLLQFWRRISLVFFSSSSSTRVPYKSLLSFALSVFPRFAKAFFSIWYKTSQLSSFKQALSFQYSFQI